MTKALSSLQNFYKSTLTYACDVGVTKIYVATLPSVSVGYAVINPASTTKREIIYYTAIGTDGVGNYLNVTSAGDRGLGGTTDQTHDVLESVRMNITAEHFNDLIYAIQSIIAGGVLDASTSAKGITKMSVAPVSASNPIAVGTNDPRVPTADPATLFTPFGYGIPTGAFVPFGGTSAPSGWVICNGSAISRATFSALFAVIGTNFGAGDGSTTFNVPDLRSRMPIGIGAVTKVATFSSRSGNVLTVTGLSNSTSNEFQTGQMVRYTTTSGAIGGLTHNTDYYIVRVTNTTFSLATTLANAQNGTVITLSSDGSGTQLFTLTLTTRTIGETGGEEKHA